MKTALQWTGRVVLGLIFLTAAGLKIADPAAFTEDILHYRLLPYPLAAALALYLPWLEAVCALALLCRWRERAALLLLTGLCLLFTGALTSAWLRGLNIACGCFGQSSANVNLPLVILRSVVLGAAAFSLFLATRPSPAARLKVTTKS